MHRDHLEQLLTAVQQGAMSIESALAKLSGFPAEQVDGSCLDHQRTLRTGIPEVIYGSSKSVEQLTAIAEAMLKQPGPLLATRISPEKAEEIRRVLPELSYHPLSRMLTANEQPPNSARARGTIVVLSAGTSDLPVAEEARLTAHCLGHPVETLYDVGVAGLHRLLARQELLAKAAVIIVAAGMEGALPSVVGGLVDCPVIGVPTSVGYGAGTGGFAALLGMLNSCAPGVAVVNIDNGFGAACMAMAINREPSDPRISPDPPPAP